MEIFQPERERAVIERAVGMLKDKGLSRGVADIVASVMDVGKLWQLATIFEGGERLERESFDAGARVAYQGVPGAFLSVPITASIKIVLSKIKHTRPVAEFLAGRLPH